MTDAVLTNVASGDGGQTSLTGDTPDNASENTPTRKLIAERPGFRDVNIELRRNWLKVREELTQAEAANDTAAIHRCTYELDRIASEFFTKNKGLAVSGAKPFLSPGDMNGDDYVSAASLGLWEAFHRWDPEKGVTFGTFSRQFIKGRVVRGVRHTEYGHISQTDFNRRKEVRDTLLKLTDELDRVPTREELAKAVGLTVNAVNRSLAPAAASLDLPVGDGSATLGDIVASDEDFSSNVDLTDQSNVDRLLDELNELELWVVNARGELLGTPPQSLVEIADEVGVGREIARRSEAKARARLKYTSMSMELGRLPDWDEFAAGLGITESVTTSGKTLTPAEQARAAITPSWQDLHGRWKRASQVLSDARNSRDWSASDRRRARLDRLGEEVVAHGARLIAEQSVLFSGTDGAALGDEQATVELWEAFRSWDPDHDVQFPAWYKRSCNAKYRRVQGERQTSSADEIAAASVNLWSKIRRSGRDVL